MDEEELTQKLQDEIEQKFGKTWTWFRLGSKYSELDGILFEAEELCAIADAMDKLKEAQNGKVQEEGQG